MDFKSLTINMNEDELKEIITKEVERSLNRTVTSIRFNTGSVGHEFMGDRSTVQGFTGVTVNLGAEKKASPFIDQFDR